MSSTIYFYARANAPVGAIEAAFRTQLTARGADPARYWLNFHAADDEQRLMGERDYGFEPEVVFLVQPPRGDGDAPLSRAALEIAHLYGMELIAHHDGALLFTYRNGVAQFSPRSREYYENDVLPGFAGRVEWKEFPRD